MRQAHVTCALAMVLLGWHGTVRSPGSRPSAQAVPRPGDLFVANLESSEVAWFDGASGAYCGAFVPGGDGGLRGATGIAFGPDGDLFVGSVQTHEVLRYDGETGMFEGVFVAGGELESPFSLIFGPDGHLYVSSGTSNRVLRYHGRTGAFLGVAAEGDGLRQPIGLSFSPHDGLLYVVNSVERTILRFDPATGMSRGVFAADSLAFPSDLTFGPDGDLFVSNAASSSVARLDGRSGDFVETLLRLPGQGGVPMGLAFRDDGALVVGDFGRSRLYLVDAAGEHSLLADQGLRRPENIAIKPALERRTPAPDDVGTDRAAGATCTSGEVPPATHR